MGQIPGCGRPRSAGALAMRPSTFKVREQLVDLAVEEAEGLGAGIRHLVGGKPAVFRRDPVPLVLELARPSAGPRPGARLGLLACPEVGLDRYVVERAFLPEGVQQV